MISMAGASRTGLSHVRSQGDALGSRLSGRAVPVTLTHTDLFIYKVGPQRPTAPGYRPGEKVKILGKFKLLASGWLG